MFILKPRVNIDLDLTHGGHVCHVHGAPRHGPGLHHLPHHVILQEVHQGPQGRGEAVREQQEEGEHSLGGERE